MNANVQAALDRIGANDRTGYNTAGRSKAYVLAANFAAVGSAAGTIVSTTITVERGKFFEADQINYEFWRTSDGVPVYDDASPTLASNTSTPAAFLDIRISTNDRAWQSDWMPLPAIAGRASRPAWFPFKPTVGGGENLVVEIRNRTGVALAGAVLFVGSLHTV